MIILSGIPLTIHVSETDMLISYVTLKIILYDKHYCPLIIDKQNDV